MAKDIRSGGLHDQLNKALGDIDIILDIQKTLIKDVVGCDDKRLLKELKEEWTAHQQSSLSNHSVLAITSKKLEKMEWIKKVLDTESKFLDDERKWIDKERNTILEQKHRGSGKGSMLGAYNSESFNIMNSTLRKHRHTDSDINRTKDKLEIEIEVLEKLNQDVQQELDRINEEKLDLIDKEESIQKQKLKLLLQYDSIKKLENFYNEYHSTDKQITIEGTEAEHGNMRELFQKYLKVAGKKNVKYYDTKDRSMMIAFALHKMIYCLWHVASYHQYSHEDMMIIYFNLWRSKIRVEKETESRQLKMIKTHEESQTVFGNYLEPMSDDTWFEIFWDNNKPRVLSQHVISDKKRSIHEEHLYVERKRIEREMKRYWKFKSQKSLKMIFLHLRRKQRFILAFSFMKYRINTLKLSKPRKTQKPKFLMLKQ